MAYIKIFEDKKLEPFGMTKKKIGIFLLLMFVLCLVKARRRETIGVI